ncbi:unnamed protein product [Trifolium pratense]|uniref:Uncharacterized protein n=1 Tax=Trifolium pratense TaxID=57577 RepID=A0ACB0J3D6_TRIPR|nr:unnamed protein product [Trifolium pratense]
MVNLLTLIESNKTIPCCNYKFGEVDELEAIESFKVDSKTENNSCLMERNSDYFEVSCERRNDEKNETQKANKSSKVD